MSKIDFRVPFPELGEGRFVYFSLRDIAELEDEYGTGEVFNTIEEKLQKNSAQHTMRALEVGLKEEKDGKPVRCFNAEDYDLPAAAAIKPIMNALARQHFGKDYDTLLKEAEEMAKQALEQMTGEGRDDDDPSKAPEAPSDS